MSWNNLPTWTKTGVVFASIFVAIVIADLVLLCDMGTSMLDPCGMLLVFATLPLFPFISYFGEGYSAYLGTVVLGLILYFGVGAGIGWLFSRLNKAS